MAVSPAGATGSLVILDPTDESAPDARTALERPASLDGLRVGLLDISKARGDVFLDRLAELLAERGITVRRYAKPTFTKPMPPDLRREITTECDVVIEALAD
ncbi:hypothetical protein LWC33_10455 [Pseudonocardia sp. RS11V-5]|nr:hypothetical protein [Pseudonocardia terrae]